MKKQVAPEIVSGSWPRKTEREISRTLEKTESVTMKAHRSAQRQFVEDMDLIALAHMSFEEAAAQLFSQPSVSAEEFRAVYEKLHSKNEGEEKEAARLIEEQAHSWDAVDLAEEAQKEAELALADEKKKTASLETDVADLEIELANVKAVLRNQ